MAYNYRMLIQYDGTRYAGWQKQGNTDATVQGKLEHLLSRLYGYEIEVFGAGRTDAGVHAAGQVANFKLETQENPDELMKKINQYLPEDIAVIHLEEAEARFHSRLNAKGKTYVYRIWNSSVPSVFERRFVLQLAEKLDTEAMRAAARELMGTHDFRAFCSLKRYKKSTVRSIYSLDIEERGEEIRLIVRGDGFLYNMVRILAGTLIEVGLGERKPEEMQKILASRDRQQAGHTAPPQGLILQKVWY